MSNQTCCWLMLLFSHQVMCDSSRSHGRSTPGFPAPHHLPDFAQVHVHWIGDATQPFHPMLPSSPSALNLSEHQGFFQWVSCLHQVAKGLELQTSASVPSYEYSGLISFKIVWFDLLPVQGTLRSLLQHQSSIESINSLVLCLLYVPAPTYVHDYWKDHSLDYTG